MQDSAGVYGIQGHITSLKPLKPENFPDEWEKKALKSFEEGVDEVFEFKEVNGKHYLRLIRPIVTEKKCLECHESQGHKLGDILAGVGFSLPISSLMKHKHQQVDILYFSHGLILFLGLMGIGFGTKRIKQDITRRQRVEEELIKHRQHLEEIVKLRTAKLEESNKELKDFTYIVSHDLRAPLISVKGFVAELRYDLKPILTAINSLLPHLEKKKKEEVDMAMTQGIPKALKVIDSSVTKMNNLINAVSKLSHVGRHNLNLQPVDMKTVVQETLNILAHQIEDSQVKVEVGSLPEIIVDKISLEQIMANILSNAINYLDSNRPGEIEISSERGKGETIFHIRDNGRGIAEDDMHKVFAPFRRAGRQDVPGDGMGLAYVQVLIRRHGGRIWCKSKLGVGTTFSFTIPDNSLKGDSYAI
jgi:signal transduction histidine kinase